MDTPIQPKQIVTLGVALLLAVGSYWIPPPPSILIPSPESPELLMHSIPVELEIFNRTLVKVWPSP
jgi:hypothetical protein